MLKSLLIILSFQTVLGFTSSVLVNPSQTELNVSLNRFLYKKYFKQLFKYEPAMIRENNISHLEVNTRQTIRDSVLSSGMIHKVSFRKDGRPNQMIEWSTYYNDSLITDYSYDSLGNLIEAKVWTPKYIYSQKSTLVKRKSLFVYEGNQLVNVYNLYNPNDGDKLQLNRCDSISILSETNFTSFYANLANLNIMVYPESKEIPKLKYILAQTYHIVENPLNLTFDDESLWNQECTFTDSTLLKLQLITGQNCYNKAQVNLLKGYANIFNSYEFKSLTENQFIDSALYRIGNQTYVDTINQKIIKCQSSFFSEPTSLENRNTSTNSVSYYNYHMSLLRIESITESSRGEHEYGKDSSETIFTYFDFGLLKMKKEMHFNEYRFGYSNPDNTIELMPLVKSEETKIIKFKH